MAQLRVGRNLMMRRADGKPVAPLFDPRTKRYGLTSRTPSQPPMSAPGESRHVSGEHGDGFDAKQT
jgi:hypothetical protein